MQEIKSSEVNETKAPEVENYRNIQPENGMTVSEAKDFWNKETPSSFLQMKLSEGLHVKKNLLNMERMVSSIRILNLIFLRFRREQ